MASTYNIYTQKNLYEVIGVPNTATAAEIKAAIREKSRQYHPDLNPGDKEAADRMMEVNDAREVLTDPDFKAQYDESLRRPKPVGSPGNTANPSGFANGATSNPITDFFNQNLGDFFPSFTDIFSQNLGDMFTPYTSPPSQNYQRSAEIAYDELMIFLVAQEPEFKKFKKTIQPKIDSLSGKRGHISTEEISALRRSIRESLGALDRNAKAFDSFSKFYQGASQRAESLYSRKLTKYTAYLDPKNRVAFSPDDLGKQRREIEDFLLRWRIQRDDLIKKLRAELEKRNLNFYIYLEEKETDINKISTSKLAAILKTFLIEEINATLGPLGITIDEFLSMRGKSLKETRYPELLKISAAIKGFMNSNQDISLANLNTIKIEDGGPKK